MPNQNQISTFFGAGAERQHENTFAIEADHPAVLRVRGDASPGELRQLVEQAVARSAAHDVLTRGVPVTVDVAAG